MRQGLAEPRSQSRLRAFFGEKIQGWFTRDFQGHGTPLMVSFPYHSHFPLPYLSDSGLGVGNPGDPMSLGEIPENPTGQNRLLNWLVVEPTHLKNIRQIGSFPPGRGEIQNVWVATTQWTSFSIFPSSKVFVKNCQHASSRRATSTGGRHKTSTLEKNK